MEKLNNLALELLKHYLDEDFQITVDRNPGKWTTGNGLLHTGFAVVLLRRLNINIEYDWAFSAFQLAETPQQPGVFHRNFNRLDRNAHDDYYGIVAASSVMGWDFHKRVLIHGLKHCFFYDNTNHKFDTIDDIRSWRIRMPFVILWYFLANKKLTFLRYLFKIYLKYLIDTKHCSGIIKAYCALGSLTLIDPKYWESFEKQWLQKYNLPKACEEYFKTKEHPLVGLSQYLYYQVNS